MTVTSSVGGYYAVSSDSKGDSIIENDNFKNHSIVTVEDGQYLNLSRAKASLYSDSPKMGFSGGVLKEGMYKVGKDISPGEYKVHPTSDLGGYYEVVSSSAVPQKTVTNDNFKGDTYITVEEGQYIKLSRAELVE